MTGMNVANEPGRTTIHLHFKFCSRPASNAIGTQSSTCPNRNDQSNAPEAGVTFVERRTKSHLHLFSSQHCILKPLSSDKVVQNTQFKMLPNVVG